MNWWSSPWAQGIGWIALYAAISWGSSILFALLEKRFPAGRLNDAAQIARLLIPLAAAFLIGMRVHVWWWVAGPPLAIVLLHLTYPVIVYARTSPANRQQMGTGLVLAAATLSLSALLTAIAAAAGVWLGQR